MLFRSGVVQPYTWEGCVVKISDKIAFLGRDIEDARSYHILDMGSYRQLREIVASTLGFGPNKKDSTHTTSGVHRSGRAVNTTTLINDLIVDLCEQSTPEKGICFSQPYFEFIKELKQFNFANIYNHWRLVEFQKYASEVLCCIYRTLMKTQVYAQSGRISQSLRNFPSLCKTFEDWLIKYTNYAPGNDTDRKHTLHYDTKQVFNINEWDSYQKCVIEYLSGMSDQYAISCFEEIISF